LQGAPVAPPALTLLLRRYASTGRADFREGAERALTDVLDALEPEPGAATARVHAEWLHCLVEAVVLSPDERLQRAARSLATELRRTWPSRGLVADAMAGVSACLAAAPAIGDAAAPTGLIPAAVDELERAIRLSYEPGDGVSHTLTGGAGKGLLLRDQIEAAAALLAAYSITGRLPYAMLADELAELVRRRWWNAGCGGLDASVEDSCRAVRVFCRIAALHEDADYRALAVTAPQADRAADARSVLAAHQGAVDRDDIDSAVEYALALQEFLRLHPDLQ
jgi:hypothetical protein